MLGKTSKASKVKWSPSGGLPKAPKAYREFVLRYPAPRQDRGVDGGDSAGGTSLRRPVRPLVEADGREPLLRANPAGLVGDLTAIEGVADAALTTNGILLAQHAMAVGARRAVA